MTMHHALSEYVNIFITQLAIVDPMGAIPIFVSLTHTLTPKRQKSAAWISALTVALVLIGAVLLGETLLAFFGISIASFRVAGGLLLLLMGINMLHAQQLTGYRNFGEGNGRNTSQENVAVVPLAIPLLSGPGAISSMTIYAHRDPAWTHSLWLIAISLLVALLTGWMLRLAIPLSKTLGKTGLSIAVRLMGLLLSAAAVQIIANGLIQLFPKLI